MNFKVIDNQGIAAINQAISQSEYNGCEYQYSYMCAWMSRHPQCLMYAHEDGVVYVYFKCMHLPIKRGQILFLPPIAPIDKIAAAYVKIFNYAKQLGESANVIAAPIEHIQALDGNYYTFEKIANADEYLYSSSDIIELSGKKYHAKRNHIAKFNRNYNYIFRDYKDSDKDGIFQLYNMWKEDHDEYESREDYAIKNMLEHHDDYGVKVGVIEIEGKIIAFSFNEMTANGRGIVHFEKADTSYDGSYAVINNLSAKAYLSQSTIINRQEDLGIEGLKKAKLSYYPIGYCEKWLITEKIN